MKIEEIRKNAPEGATHYSENQIGLLYVKYIEGKTFYTYSDKTDWRKMNPHYDSIKPL